MEVNKEDYINEVLHCMKELDVIKTEILISHINSVDAKTQRRLIFELAKAEESFSIAMIKRLIENNFKILIDTPVLQQVLLSTFLSNSEILKDFLMDENLFEARTFLIELAGSIKCEDVIPELLTILNEESNSKNIILIIKTLGDIESSEAVNPIAEYLYTVEKKNIETAIEALKKIGTGPAVQRLVERLGSDQKIDVLIIDALAVIQDKTSLSKLNETLIAHSAFIRNYGKSKLVEIGSKSIPVLIENLLLDDPDLLIHTLNVLGEIGDESAITPIRKLLFKHPKDHNVRFALYETLGLLPMKKTAYVLAGGLSDPVDNVCMVAAKAINSNYNTILSAGISNLLLNPDDNEQNRLIRIIVDSESDIIVLDQLDNPLFYDAAIKYIKNDIPESLQKMYIKIFRKNGYNSLADEILLEQSSKTTSKLKISVVDDSRMILGIYRSILHRLGYEAKLYEFPASGIDEIFENKPDIVFTDLNMPNITGIELAAKIRTKYSAAELPIIMVTTQNETNDTQSAYTACVNIVMHKPFTEESLQASIKEVMNNG